MDVTIEPVTDVDAAFPELAALLEELHAYHQPLRPHEFVPDWRSRWNGYLRQGERLILLARKGQEAVGYLNGTMTGVGMLLISLLMAAGLQGAAVIGTDAIISVIMGFAKIALFGGVARLDAELALAGVLIGLCTAPGGFIARRLLAHIPLKVHTAFMDAIVLAGGASFLWRALG